MRRRQLRSNPYFNDLFAAFDPDEEEIEAVSDCLELLEVDPERGTPFVYSGHAGRHWSVECGRFVLVYQFSNLEVRPKDILLGERWR